MARGCYIDENCPHDEKGRCRHHPDVIAEDEELDLRDMMESDDEDDEDD